MSTTTEFLDPRAQPKAVAEPYDIKVDLDSPLTIGLVANGFPDSVRFLDHVEKTLAQAVPSDRLSDTTRVTLRQLSAEKCSKTSEVNVKRLLQRTVIEAVALLAPCVTAFQ